MKNLNEHTPDLVIPFHFYIGMNIRCIPRNAASLRLAATRKHAAIKSTVNERCASMHGPGNFTGIPKSQRAAYSRGRVILDRLRDRQVADPLHVELRRKVGKVHTMLNSDCQSTGRGR